MQLLSTALQYGIFVREEYFELCKLIDKAKLKDSDIRRIQVLGSPGIGKSVFGVFLFLLAIQQKKNVAYRALCNCTYYFTWNGSDYNITTYSQIGYTYEGYFDGNDRGGDPLNFSTFERVKVNIEHCRMMQLLLNIRKELV